MPNIDGWMNSRLNKHLNDQDEAEQSDLDLRMTVKDKVSELNDTCSDMVLEYVVGELVGDEKEMFIENFSVTVILEEL